VRWEILLKATVATWEYDVLSETFQCDERSYWKLRSLPESTTCSQRHFRQPNISMFTNRTKWKFPPPIRIEPRTTDKAYL
jgi:hypothetical protein